LGGPHLGDEFLPTRRYASAGNSDRNVSVCPSVRHAPVLCHSVMIFSPSGRPKTSFLTPNFITEFYGVPPEREPLIRVGCEKFSDFLALSVNIWKMVADTAKVTISH